MVSEEKMKPMILHVERRVYGGRYIHNDDWVISVSPDLNARGARLTIFAEGRRGIAGRETRFGIYELVHGKHSEALPGPNEKKFIKKHTLLVAESNYGKIQTFRVKKVIEK
jgi:hypothetical protein